MFGSPLDIEQAFGHPRAMSNRTRVRRRRLVAVLLAAGVVGLLSGPVANAVSIGREVGASRTYVVRSGDTLWSIATRFEPSEDPRVVVAAIASANGVDPAALVPGRELVIPASG